jgi:hypothetical protein
LTVEKLDENRVLIILCDKDFNDFSLNYDKMSLDDSHSRNILMKIFRLACTKAGIDFFGKTALFEAMMFENECYLLVTVDVKKPRTYRLKSCSQSLCYRLGKSGNFLDTLEQLYRQNVCCNRNSAYLYNDEYYLIFDYPSIPRKLRHVLSEYGKKSTGKLNAARIKENGKPLCTTNAIAQIGRFLV